MQDEKNRMKIYKIFYTYSYLFRYIRAPSLQLPCFHHIHFLPNLICNTILQSHTIHIYLGFSRIPSSNLYLCLRWLYRETCIYLYWFGSKLEIIWIYLFWRTISDSIPVISVHSYLFSPPDIPLHPHLLIPFLQHNPSTPHDGQGPFSQPNWVLHSSPMFISGILFCRQDSSSQDSKDDGDGSIENISNVIRICYQVEL